MTTDADSRVVEAARRVAATLRRRGETMAVAESCTGGWLGREMTSEEGASEVFWGGVIAYDDAAKRRLLDVPAELLAAHGAVSEEVALRLAEQVRRLAGAAWGVAVTGIAGPGGGSSEKPVGTVWIAVAGPGGSTAMRRQLTGDRSAIRRAAVEAALQDLLGRLDRSP